jgi:hypothetical protein
VLNYPGGLRKMAGWCAEVERLHFDRSSYEIIELADGPFAFCASTASEPERDHERTQKGEIKK